MCEGADPETRIRQWLCLPEYFLCGGGGMHRLSQESGERAIHDHEFLLRKIHDYRQQGFELLSDALAAVRTDQARALILSPAVVAPEREKLDGLVRPESSPEINGAGRH